MKDDTSCNMCGEIPQNGILHEQEMMGQYVSYHLLDLNVYKFALCEKCLRQLFMQFKMPPDVHDKMNYDVVPYSFKDDQEQWEFREWQTHGGFHQAYVNGLCNAKKDCSNEAVYTVLHEQESNFSEDCCCEEHKTYRWNFQNTTWRPFIPNNLKVFL